MGQGYARGPAQVRPSPTTQAPTATATPRSSMRIVSPVARSADLDAAHAFAGVRNRAYSAR